MLVFFIEKNDILKLDPSHIFSKINFYRFYHLLSLKEKGDQSKYYKTFKTREVNERGFC